MSSDQAAVITARRPYSPSSNVIPSIIDFMEEDTFAAPIGFRMFSNLSTPPRAFILNCSAISLAVFPPNTSVVCTLRKVRLEELTCVNVLLDTNREVSGLANVRLS